MDNLVQASCVPIITIIVYNIIEVLKYSVKNKDNFKRYIPLFSLLFGAILGVLAFYFANNLMPATNILSAILIGSASGLSATGTNQVIKQLGVKKCECELKSDTIDSQVYDNSTIDNNLSSDQIDNINTIENDSDL